MKFALAEKNIDGFPLVIPSGEITEDSLVELGAFIRKSCDDIGVKGAIIDAGRIEGALSPQSLYRATPAFTMEIGQTIKVAYVNRPDEWIPADDQFSRDLAYNRGGMLELFESTDDALDWLRDA